MLLVHFSDLHLGHRAYERAEGGKNVRERDVSLALARGFADFLPRTAFGFADFVFADVFLATLSPYPFRIG